MRGFQAKCCTDAAQAQHVEQNRPNMAQLPDIGSSVSNRRSMELPSLMKFVTPPEMPYISSRALKGLRDYKYVAGGYTWLDRVHTPFWNRTVEFFPLWLAPNLITLIGTGWLVLGYLVSSTYLTEFKGATPPPPSPPAACHRSRDVPPTALRERCAFMTLSFAKTRDRQGANPWSRVQRFVLHLVTDTEDSCGSNLLPI